MAVHVTAPATSELFQPEIKATSIQGEGVAVLATAAKKGTLVLE